MANQLSAGLKFRTQLRFTDSHAKDHNVLTKVEWSRDGKKLAVPSRSGIIRLWDTEKDKVLHTIKAHPNGWANSLAWSPDGSLLFSGGGDKAIKLIDTKTGKLLPNVLKGYKQTSGVHKIGWSPDGKKFFVATNDDRFQLWDTSEWKILSTTKCKDLNCIVWSPDSQTICFATNKEIYSLEVNNGKTKNLWGHTGPVYDLAWSPDGKILASASGHFDRTIRLWQPSLSRELAILEGHTGSIRSISFSSDNKILASKADDNTVRLWRCDSFELVAIIDEQKAQFRKYAPGIAFNPRTSVLATLGENDIAARIWDIDVDTLLGAAPVEVSVRYANAKVVLVGDSGGGKSGLGLVLSGQTFVPTESTHGRRIWTMCSEDVELENERKETREILLWDLAGQPGYRLIHQLHLNEVTVALIVFDARSEIDPFAGVRHWNRALNQAQRLQGEASPPITKFLVAARVDRTGVSVGNNRINQLLSELNIDSYFETSAKEGWEISELIKDIKKSISWDILPKVSSTELFQSIKNFLKEEKEAGRILPTAEDLMVSYLAKNHSVEKDSFRAQFETCIGRVESRGLIRRLSFGNFILLQPELLDSYASAIVNTAKEEPDGLGSINEDDALAGRFRMSEDERISNKKLERLLLIATVEDLLRHEIALRETSEDGVYLVFPTQFTRENPDLPNPEGKAVIFTFEGAVLNIYAVIAVRLSHSRIFSKKDMWRNAATYQAKMGGVCGMFIREIEEGKGELTIFFDKLASEETRFQFEDYIETHLNRRALTDSIFKRRIFRCDNCDVEVTETQIQARRKLGYNFINCPICEKVKITLADPSLVLKKIHPSIVLEIDEAADEQREYEALSSSITGKIETQSFDVFMCHNSIDKTLVKQIAEQLKKKGILPWLDEWELRPGFSAIEVLEQQIENIKSVAVFIGNDGIGPWQVKEQRAFLTQFSRREIPIIPVILPDCKQTPQIPVFLGEMTWVDFRKTDPAPLDQLVWGITGDRIISEE